jgi:hypothetical protein
MRNEREQKLWEASVEFVARECPHLDLSDVVRTANKVYRAMRFVTEMTASQDHAA